MKKRLRILLVTFVMISACKDKQDLVIFSLAPNGVTITCEGASPGDKQEVNGITYTAVDRSLLITMRDKGADLDRVCTSPVSDMNRLFRQFYHFNEDISSWDVSSVTNMESMFELANYFNQDLNSWDVSSVTNMEKMFSKAHTFNGTLGNWDVSSVTDMPWMFYKAANFNQDLSDWCVEKISSEPYNFSNNSALVIANYPVWGTCPSQ